MKQNNLLGPALGRGKKYIKHIKQDSWVMPQGWDSWTGVRRVSKKYLSEHGHVAYQIDGDDERNRI